MTWVLFVISTVLCFILGWKELELPWVMVGTIGYFFGFIRNPKFRKRFIPVSNGSYQFKRDFIFRTVVVIVFILSLLVYWAGFLFHNSFHH